jgi:hypothetical protein
MGVMGLDHRVPPRSARLLPAAASVTGLDGSHLSWKSGEARSSASLRRCCRSFRRSFHPGMPCAARRALAQSGQLARSRGDMTGRSAPPGARSVWSSPAPRRRARRRSTRTWWAGGMDAQHTQRRSRQHAVPTACYGLHLWNHNWSPRHQQRCYKPRAGSAPRSVMRWRNPAALLDASPHMRAGSCPGPLPGPGRQRRAACSLAGSDVGALARARASLPARKMYGSASSPCTSRHMSTPTCARACAAPRVCAAA